MNSRVLLLASLFGGIMTLSTKAQTITAPTGQNLTITNPVDVTGTGNTINVPNDGSYKIGGSTVLSTKGTSNLFIGPSSGIANTAANNVFMGANSGYTNTSGTENIFFGAYSGYSNIGGSYNLFGGTNAGFSNSSGQYNIFLGSNSGFSTTTGGYNLVMGAYAGYYNVGGTNNAFIGTNAGFSNTTGTQNVFIGSIAGNVNTTGNNNTCIGYLSNVVSGTLTNATAIGASSSVSTSNTVVLGNAATTVTGTGLGAGVSGLKFANLTSASSTTAVGGSKVLSVDATGNVVLVALTTGTVNSVGGPVTDATWKNQDGYLYNNSTTGVVINGTGLDGNSLIVKGGVLSKEVNVKVEGSESWPDYVFKPSYKRMTLDEVEKFININGHLPNVASATEMEATGNNLNKTDIKLLEKVEELTLYLLEMKKANEVQNAEIQNLKKQVKSLRKK